LLKETIALLNSDDKAKCSISVSRIFSTNSSHLIIDFVQMFEKSIQIDLKTKLIILQAVLNKCKIIRIEWISHCKMKKCWLDERSYLLENYLSKDLNEYDEYEFDVRLVKLIRRLPSIKLDLFSAYKNVFIIRERSESKLTSEIDSDDNEEIDDNSKKVKIKSTLHFFLSELLVKCGSILTNNPSKAELLIAIDKTNDYDENNKAHANKIKMDQKYFLNNINKLKNLISHELNVISSEWVLGKLIFYIFYK
jgi:hypothetical protein